MRKRIYIFSAICAVVLFCSLTLAQEPGVTIDKKLFPNLAEAQHHLNAAAQYVANAQKDPNNHFAGHADKARILMDQADQEIRAAAEAALAAAKQPGKN